MLSKVAYEVGGDESEEGVLRRVKTMERWRVFILILVRRRRNLQWEDNSGMPCSMVT